MDGDGLKTTLSAHTATETLARLEGALAGAGVTVFAKIDHAAGAAAVGLSLRPTTVVIFGNPRAGTPLMQADQRAGLDLPLKALVWEDEAGRAQLTYSDPHWVARRYGLPETAADGLASALERLASAATA